MWNPGVDPGVDPDVEPWSGPWSGIFSSWPFISVSGRQGNRFFAFGKSSVLTSLTLASICVVFLFNLVRTGVDRRGLTTQPSQTPMSVLDRLIASSLPFVPKPLVGYFARPYIAGETLDDQARVVRSLNDEGFMAATGILGEFVERRDEAEGAVADYQNALLRIEQDKLGSNVHVKPTLLGLKIDKEFCYQSTRKLVAFAREHSNFVRIDMEDSSCTDDTLEVFLRLREEFDNVGAVIQAYLKRSLDDARRLAEVKANVRVCKGIYIEPPDIAYRNKDQVRSNFVSLLEELLGAGCYVGIATHDDKLVSEGYRIVDRMGLDASRYEFQMLLGVTPGLRNSVRDAGHRLRVAVPFGPAWYPYSLRRFRENPTIAGYVFKALFRHD